MPKRLISIEEVQEKRSEIYSFRTEKNIKEEENFEKEIEKTQQAFQDTFRDPKAIANIQAALQRLKDINSFKKADETKSSKKEIIDHALEIICKHLNAQTAAIFLVSKDGILERTSIYGQDKDGNALKDDDCVKDKSYLINDQSFTGRAAYGEIQYIENFSDGNLRAECIEEYRTKLGNLKCAIAIPLKGRNKTYGVLRVINKQGETQSGETIFTIDDVKVLLYLATGVETAISNFRRDEQINIFAKLSNSLITPAKDENSLNEVYQQVIDSLVQNPETAFRAGIIRVLNDNSKKLEIRGKSLISGVDKNRKNEPRETDDSLLGLIIKAKRRLIIKNIQSKEQIEQFYNKIWIENNKFQSLAIFPLVAKDETLGTLSLYAGNVGYDYEFHADSASFLQSIADLVAAFIFKTKQEKQEKEIQEQLAPSIAPKQLENIESRFKFLAQEWRNSTKTTLSMNAIFMNRAYQQIIGLGDRVVPFLLKELEKEKTYDWFWALTAIIDDDDNPVQAEDQGSVHKMRAAWLEWGKSKNYV